MLDNKLNIDIDNNNICIVPNKEDCIFISSPMPFSLPPCLLFLYSTSLWGKTMYPQYLPGVNYE